MNQILNSVPTWLIFGFSVVLFMIVTELGFRRGRAIPNADAIRGQVSTIQSAVLALLGLLLGFSFSMAVGRYDDRRLTVLNESNAIGTAYLRAQMLPQPYRAEIEELFRLYLAARIDTYSRGADYEHIAAGHQRMTELQNKLWERTVAALEKDSRPTTALFMSSLNEVIDMHEVRITALEAHVPPEVLIILIVCAAAGLGLTGYAGGLSGHRNLTPTCVAAFMIALVTAVVIDLDRPGQGVIRIDQRSLIRLQESIGQPATPVGGAR